MNSKPALSPSGGWTAKIVGMKPNARDAGLKLLNRLAALVPPTAPPPPSLLRRARANGRSSKNSAATPNFRSWPIHACRAALLLGVVSRPWQTVKVRVLSPERGAVSLRGRKHHAVRHSKAVMDRETRGL